VVLVVAALWLRPASSRQNTATLPTIEPTLPLALDLEVLPADPIRGTPSRLAATLDASRDLQEVSWSLVLPEAVGAGDQAIDPGHPFRLRSGERRIVTVPIQARRAGAFPLKVEVVFRLPDGRVFHTQQGIVWRNGVAAPGGRHHAGAYEWMGVPVEEPLP